jgi:hypothetical protein
MHVCVSFELHLVTTHMCRADQNRKFMTWTWMALVTGIPYTYSHISRVSQNCIYWVGQNRIYAPYMTVYLVISLPKIPYIHRIYIWIWPTLCIYTVYGRIFGGFPDKNTVCTPYMYACGANPTHTVCTYSRGQRILFQKQQLLLYSIA